MKVCDDCGADFRTKSGTRFCDVCRHARSKHPCSKCGEPCHPRATICRPCRLVEKIGEVGAANPNWQGGRIVNKLTGYARLRLPDHPRAHNGYVLEHVVVMEDALGRDLWPDENVHHRNGQRDDNRIENLELWVKAQPAGQRVEDLVAWAKEILCRYGGGASTL